MTDSPARMSCPTCEDQVLETLKFPQGTLQRCTNCLFFWVELKTLASLSEDRTTFMTLIEESKALLLPTARFCPVCYQKLHHGRIKSRQLILTICPVCQALWIDFPTLNQLDPALERTLKTALDYGPPTKSSGAAESPSSTDHPRKIPSGEDKGVGRLFRGVANVFDRMADRASSDKPPSKPIEKKATPAPKVKKGKDTKPAATPPLPSTPAPLETPVAEPVVPTPTEPPVTPPILVPVEPPPIVVKTPDVVPAFQAIEPVPDPVVIEPISPPVVVPEIPVEPIVAALEIPKEAPKEIVERPPEKESVEKKEEPVVDTPLLIEKISEAPPTPEVRLEPPLSSPTEEEVHRELLSQTAPKPKTETPKPVEPAPVKIPTKAPVIPVLPQPKPRPGRLAGVLNFFKPSKSKPKPIREVKPTVPPATLPLEKAKEMPPVVSVPKLADVPADIPVTAPLISETPPAPAPVIIPEPIPAPRVEPKSVTASEPEKKIEKPVKVTPPPKVKAPKVPKEPKVKKPPVPFLDHAAGWVPRLLPIIVFLLNLTKGPDFDTGTAIVEALLAWAGALIFRLIRMYPFKPFIDMTVQDLLIRKGISRWRGFPVRVKGKLIEGPVVMFADETGTIALNLYSKLDFIPKLFGISALAKLPTEDVTIQGWLRGAPTPFIDISDVRAGTVSRKALVKGLRWASAVVIILISTLILLSD